MGTVSVNVIVFVIAVAIYVTVGLVLLFFPLYLSLVDQEKRLNAEREYYRRAQQEADRQRLQALISAGVPPKRIAQAGYDLPHDE